MHMEILHEQKTNEGEFYIENNDSQKIASLFYTLFGSGRLVIQHTEVSQELSGTGIAVRLINKVADHARAKGLKIIPVCPFAKSYMIKRRGRYEDVLV